MSRVNIHCMKPAFARDYPKSDAIDALVERFDAGDYAAVREGAKKLEAHADSAVRNAARDLASRTEPDPAMKWLFAAMVTMVAVVSAYFVLKNR